MYDAIKASLTYINLLLGATFEAHRAAVAASHGIALDTLAAVIRSKQDEYQYPHAEITPVSGPVEVNGDAVYGEYHRWVMVVDRDADPAALALRMDAWATVLVRTFAKYDAPDGTWAVTVSSVDESPPYDKNDTWVAAVGVEVIVKMGSDL